MRKKGIVYKVGINDYDDKVFINGKMIKSYIVWNDMLKRCYSSKYQEKNPTYIGCSVCDEWLSFNNFKNWYDNNYIENYQLDKDLLKRGNKIYSSDTCVFIPNFINTILIKCDKSRGKNKIGVCYHKRIKKYVAKLNKNDGVQHHLGYFDTEEVAYQAYKIAKENHIKEVALSNMLKLPIKSYVALMNYKVEDND